MDWNNVVLHPVKSISLKNKAVRTETMKKNRVPGEYHRPWTGKTKLKTSSHSKITEWDSNLGHERH